MSLADGLAGRKSREGFRVGVDDDGVAVISIDRAAKRNAITLDMWEALPSLLTDLTSVEGLRVLLITGEGDVFSAGADVRELRDIYAEQSRARAYEDTNVAAEAALASFPYPTVAAIRGACIGGGCQLAVACDVRLAADTAQFGVTPAKFGIVYPVEPTARLTRLIGPARAKYLLYSADLVGAAQALTFGLVDEVVPDAGLETRALEFARTIAGRSPQTVGAAKAVINALGSKRDANMELAAGQRATDDVREGITAFLDGRKPRFGDAR
ncbi:MAG TPA: enoyl-CoA hydratase/isomerase family protein [Micromonosporaceae bacterium]